MGVMGVERISGETPSVGVVDSDELELRPDRRIFFKSNKNNDTKLARYRYRCICQSKDPVEGWPRQPNEALNFPAKLQ